MSLLLFSLIFFANSLYASDTVRDKTAMFPKAKEGDVQYIISVPKTPNDYNHKVELIIGKTMLVDCNKHSFSGKVEEVTLKGWGYKYIEVSQIQSGPSTMMECNEPQTAAFVTLHFNSQQLRRYNSRLPMVVYVPKGYEVRYRVWSASEVLQRAKKY